MRDISNCKLIMTKGDSSMILYISPYITYNAWADYISGSVSGIPFLNFELMRIMSSIAAAFWLERI